MVSNNPLISGRNSWDVACLKDISIKIGSGSTPRGGESAYIPERINFAFIRSQNIYDFKFDVNGLKFISNEDANKLKGVHLQKDDVLLNITGDGVTFSRCCLVPDDILPAAVNQHVAIIRLDTTKCLPGYLMAYLCLPETKAYIESFNAGGSRRAITKGHIESFEIPLPPMHIQGEISKIALSLLAKQDINTQINQTLEQMAQALFKSWFVDFDPVVDNALDAGFFEQNLDLPDELLCRAEARQAARKQSYFKPLPDATRQLFPAAFEECAEPSLGLGGWIPKGWSVKRLDEILELVYGKALKKTDRISGDYPVYGSGGVDGTHISSLVDGPGIIVGRKGTVGSIYWESNNFFPIDTVFYVKPKKSYSLEHCHELLKTLGLEKMNTDAAVPGLNRNNAYRLLCVTPCNIISDALSKVLSSYRHRIELCEKESLALTKLRDTLLPKLISGELRLDNIAAELATEQVN